jgi:hypothetical protein
LQVKVLKRRKMQVSDEVKIEWRDNLHSVIKKVMNWERIPSLIIDAIDAAYLEGLEVRHKRDKSYASEQ